MDAISCIVSALLQGSTPVLVACTSHDLVVNTQAGRAHGNHMEALHTELRQVRLKRLARLVRSGLSFTTTQHTVYHHSRIVW